MVSVFSSATYYSVAFILLSLVTTEAQQGRISFERIGLKSNPTTSRGTLKLSENLPCKPEWAVWQRVIPDTCVAVKNTGFRTLEIIDPWPVCEDGTEAKFAVFDKNVGNCDPAQNSKGVMRKLLTQEDVVWKCKDVRNIGSFAFWCNGNIPVPKDHTKEGGLIKSPTKECDKSRKAEFHLPDTCIEVGKGLGLEFTGQAVCANGTNALIAGFKGKDCDPTDVPLERPFTVWRDSYKGKCIPTEVINSMTFWCDGLPGVDMRKPNRIPIKKGSNLGLILGLSIGLGGTFLLIVGLFVAYSINWHFREKVKQLFGSGDGYIAL